MNHPMTGAIERAAPRYPKTTRLPNQDRQILSMYRAGDRVGQIAAALTVSTHYVLCRLRAKGVDTSARAMPRYDVNPIWEMPEAERREAIARRAARGARETLEAAFVELSTENKTCVERGKICGYRAKSARKSDKFSTGKAVVAGLTSLGREPRRHSPNPVRQHGVSFTVSERTAQR